MKKNRTTKRNRAVVEDHLTRFGISLPRELLVKFEAMLDKKKLSNRSLAIADLIREGLVQDEWSEGKGEQVATITIIFNSQGSDILRRLGDCKRALGNNLLSTQHVRLSAQEDLEVLIVRGPGSALRAQAESLIGMRGILHGKMVMTTARGV